VPGQVIFNLRHQLKMLGKVNQMAPRKEYLNAKKPVMKPAEEFVKRRGVRREIERIGIYEACAHSFAHPYW